MTARATHRRVATPSVDRAMALRAHTCVGRRITDPPAGYRDAALGLPSLIARCGLLQALTTLPANDPLVADITETLGSLTSIP